MKKKQRHQVKSRWYYIFWGTATLSVFAGQMYVGTGYSSMSKSIDSILEAPIVIEQRERHYRHPMMIPLPDLPESWDHHYYDDIET